MSDLRLLFEKKGTAAYLSHLDVMRTFPRAFMRAGLQVKHTEGFRPHPYLSIPLPLPLGFSSECELLEFGLQGGGSREEVPEKLNAVLPQGLRVLDCYEGGAPFKRLARVCYEIRLSPCEVADGEALRTAVRSLIDQPQILVEKRSKKKGGMVETDIRPHILVLEQNELRDDVLWLRLQLAAQNPGLNPALFIRALTEQYMPVRHSACLRLEVFCEDGTVFR